MAAAIPIISGVLSAASAAKGLMANPGRKLQSQGAGLVNPVSSAQAEEARKQTQGVINQQQEFVNALNAQQGLQHQGDVYSQFANVAAGQGPNPAQAMLANATGANIANQAALMAGQRGAAANPALIARLAAMQGSNAQQQAAGQAAALQAQQSLNALGAMGNLANQQVSQQASGISNLGQMSQNQQNALLGSIANQNQAAANMYGTQADLAKQQTGGLFDVIGNLTGGIGKVISGIKTSNTNNNTIDTTDTTTPKSDQTAEAAEGGAVADLPKGPRSKVGQFLAGAPMMAQGGKVPALVSPGEQYLKPQDVQKVKQGANPLKVGERIPGKPMHPGNDYRNDIVPKTLEEGGIIIPNKVMQSKDPKKAAADFVAAVLARKGKIK